MLAWVWRTDFLQQRDVQELRKLFANAGMVLSDGDFSQVYARAKEISMSIEGGRRGVGIEVFRRAYNELDDARYAGGTPLGMSQRVRSRRNKPTISSAEFTTYLKKKKNSHRSLSFSIHVRCPRHRGEIQTARKQRERN